MFLLLIGVIVFVFIIECLLTEVEHWGFATATLIASIVLAQVLHVADIWGFVSHNALQTFLLVLGYLVVGVVWSFIKWFSFLIKFRDEYRETRENWFKSHNIALDQVLNVEQAAELDRILSTSWHQTFYGNPLNKKPRASNNKRRITAWMSFWPFSLVGTLINDPIRRLFTLLFNGLKALYQKISDHVFRNETGLK